MKILFSNPPWWQTDDGQLRQGIRAGSRWPFTRHAAHPPDEFKFGGYLPAPFFLQYAASFTAREFPAASVTLRDSIARGESYVAFVNFLNRETPEWIVIETATPSWEHDARLVALINHELPAARIILCGPTDSAKHKEILAAHANIAAIVQGEPDKQIAKVIAGARGVLAHDLLTLEEMNAAPLPMWDDACAVNYWDACPIGHAPAQLQIWTSRGCPFRCLAGDTPINTVEGMIPIRDLVGREGLGVFTYDLAEKRAKICTAKNILKIGENETLVRVHLDDGSHLDLTPDHRLLVFKIGNQFVSERQWEVEAKDLKPGMRLRSLKIYTSGTYPMATWARRGRDTVHRMVAEWKIGRRLKEGEQVHHIDRNKMNYHPTNLVVMADAKRMMQARDPYAWINRMRDEAGRFVDTNHRVVSVETLPGGHDVYCLEMPETHWFFANNTLAANCCFCVWPAVMTGNDPDGTKPRSVRSYSPDYVEQLINERLAWGNANGTPYRSIYLDDDTFNLTEKHTVAICAVMKKIGLPWSAMCRADTVKRPTWQLMKDAGCFGVKIGFESGSQEVIDRIVNKRLDLADARETAIWLRSIGMSVHGTFTVGLPGETEAQKKETLAFIAKLYSEGALDTHQLSGTATIDGTPLAAIAKGAHLAKYPGATNENFVVTGDGQRKIEADRR